MPGSYDRVLVTGGTGFLGSAMSEFLPGARFLGSHDVDLTDGRATAAYVSAMRPEVVVHLAARVGGIRANLNQPADFLVDNLRIDANLLHVLRKVTPRHLLVLLSTAMYPDRLRDDQYPMDEAVLEAGPPTSTRAAYAAAKRALYHATLALHAQYCVPYTCLVPANLYGPKDHFNSPNSHFVAAALSKMELARAQRATRVEFFGTGRAQRQYVYSRDVAWLIHHFVETGPALETFNVAPTQTVSIRELAEKVAAVTSFAGEVVFTGLGPDGQLRKDASPARLCARVPAWSGVETSLEQGLANTLAYLRKAG